MVFIGVFWLLFFPNAPYMLTDFVHFSWMNFYPNGTDSITINWLDFLLFSTFILNGIALGVHSLSIMQNILIKYCGKIYSCVGIAIITFLTSIAIYWGRFIRLNSWDAWRNFEAIKENLVIPPIGWLFIVLLWILLFGMFALFGLGNIVALKGGPSVYKNE
jgi:uncharacterized membrane protein